MRSERFFMARHLNACSQCRDTEGKKVEQMERRSDQIAQTPIAKHSSDFPLILQHNNSIGLSPHFFARLAAEYEILYSYERKWMIIFVPV